MHKKLGQHAERKKKKDKRLSRSERLISIGNEKKSGTF